MGMKKEVKKASSYMNPPIKSTSKRIEVGKKSKKL